MQKYYEMVDSGVDWIGEAPRVWGVKKFNSLYKKTNAGEVIPKEFWDNEGDHLLYTASQKPIKSVFANFPASKFTTVDDILIARNGDGVIHDPKPRSIYTNVVQRITLDPKAVVKNYLIYALKASLVYVHGQSNGDFIVSLNMGMWNNTRLPIPPMQTQQKIADFLDIETVKIDNLIAKQERLVQLLEEKRRATITHAVTHGLDSNVELEETNIPWLGKIPAHWDHFMIKRLGPVKRGASPRPIEDPVYFDESGEYSWVRIADVTRSGKYLNKTPQKLSALGASLSVKREPGDIFVSIAASVGKPIITNIKCCIHDGFVYFPTLNGKINFEYLWYIFTAGKCYEGLGKMGTQLNLNTETIGKIKIPFPDIGEQSLIVDHLNVEEEKFFTLKQKIKTQITLLRERRTSLISHAVTGKIKV